MASATVTIILDKDDIPQAHSPSGILKYGHLTLGGNQGLVLPWDRNAALKYLDTLTAEISRLRTDILDEEDGVDTE